MKYAFVSIDKQYRYLYFITKAQNIVAEICIQSETCANFFFFLFLRKCTERLFRFMLLQRAIERRINTTRKLFTVVGNFELHLCHDLASCRLPGIKRQCRRMNEKYHKGDERTKHIDQGGSRGQRRHAFAAKRMHTCIVLHISLPPSPLCIATSLRREIKRAKSRVWHTYLIAQATHTYTLTYYVNHGEFIVGTFKS